MLTYDNNQPVYKQVIADIKKRIINGDFSHNPQFPSTRELAVAYGINPNTAARVYRELELQQLCYSKKGVGTFLVNNDQLVNQLKKTMADKLLDSFLSNMSDLGFTKNEIINKIEKGGKT